MPKFFTLYDRPDNVSVEFRKPSKTERNHKYEVSINDIVKRAFKTGVLATEDQLRSVYYGNFDNVDQALENHLQIKSAEDQFMALPSNVREYFENDPLKFLRAMSDKNSIPTLVKLGLVKAEPPKVGTPDAPIAVPAVKPNVEDEKL